MPEVKICGLISTDDAALISGAGAEDGRPGAGADYAGFVFHAPSKRNVSIEQAREIMAALPASVRKVAVVVSPTPARAQEILSLPFDIIQIHGSCPKETLDAIRIPIWRAVNIANIDELTVSAEEKGMERISGILIDAKEYGSGQTFDWAAAEQIRRAARRLGGAIEEKSGRPVKFILAGGLHPGNVSEGIRLFGPDVVDVSSGVEYDGGRGKDPRKVEAFLKAVRS